MSLFLVAVGTYRRSFFQWFCGLTIIFWADAYATQYELIVVIGQTTTSTFHKVV